MNSSTITAVPVAKGQKCGLCGDPMVMGWSAFDNDIKLVVCATCRCRLMVAVGYLAGAGIKKCTQVSGGKPIENGG